MKVAKEAVTKVATIHTPAKVYVYCVPHQRVLAVYRKIPKPKILIACASVIVYPTDSTIGKQPYVTMSTFMVKIIFQRIVQRLMQNVLIVEMFESIDFITNCFYYLEAVGSQYLQMVVKLSTLQIKKFENDSTCIFESAGSQILF